MGFQSDTAPPLPPQAGPVYDQGREAALVRTIEMLIRLMTSNGPFSASTLQLTNLPTAPTGLRSGSVWNDTGTLKIVP
jgi:hypothetical protein